MTAAKHALAEGDFALAAQRLVYARDAEPRNPAVLRLLTTAYWQAGDYAAAARAVRDWIREEGERPAPYRTAARIYEDMGSLSQALDAAEREIGARAARRARRGSGSAGCGCARFDRAGAREALERARAIAPSEQGAARPRAGRAPARRRRAPRSPPASRPPSSRRTPQAAWSRLAHALARTDRTRECLAACERALALADDPEVRDLRDQVLARGAARAASGVRRGVRPSYAVVAAQVRTPRRRRGEEARAPAPCVASSSARR